MADSVTNARTSLGSEDVIARAVQFFSTESWRPTTQSPRTATFQGRPPIPWLMLLLTFVAFLFFVIPGVIMYFFVVRKALRFQNLVVTANPIPNGTDVVITHPAHVSKLAGRFVAALPQLEIAVAG